MNLKKLTETARRAIDARGGTDRLKQDAERLQTIAKGQGTPKEKAKAAADALKQEQRPGAAPDPAAPTRP